MADLGGAGGAAAPPPLGVQGGVAASSHEIFLRVGGREGMKGLWALQRHQLPHPLAKILDPPLRVFQTKS